MNRLLKIVIIMTAVFVSAPGAVYSLDTVESFPVGAVTDIEAYYGYDWDDTSSGHSLEFLLGGGLTETLSYLVAGGYARMEDDSMDDPFTVLGGLGLGLIWTVIDNPDSIALDILPGLTFEPNDVNDDFTSVKPNFKGYSYGAAVELNIMSLKSVQPYIVAGYTAYSKTTEVGEDEYEDDPYEIPLTFGIMVPVKEGMEVLAALDWTLNEETKAWAETDRGLALGLNVGLAENLELITELGMSFAVEDSEGNEISSAGYGIGIGAIYAP